MHPSCSRLNERRATSFEGEEVDAGFTLIELMVVLLIMAILLAIAIPTFLGVKGGAQDRAAQSNLNTALTNAKAIYGNNQSYGGVTQAQASLSSAEASLTFDATNLVTSGTVTVPNPGVPGQIEVATSADGAGILLVNRSQNGDCWAILTNEATITSAFYSATGALPITATTNVWPITTPGTYYLSVKPATSTTCTIPTTIGTNTPGKWQQNSFTGAA